MNGIFPISCPIPKEMVSVVKVLVTQLCLSLCDPMDSSPADSPVHGILQARVLEWVAILFSRGSSWPRDWTQVSCTAGGFFTVWATRKAQLIQRHSPNNSLLRQWRRNGKILKKVQSWTKIKPGIEPRSSTLQLDSLPSEPPGKPMNTGVGSLSLL